MPYRQQGRVVEVKKDGIWKVLKRHPSVRAAAKHMMALRLNVKHGKGS